MTPVTAVEVAPDLKTCKAYISVLGEKQAKDSTIRGLKNAEGYIRRELARRLTSTIRRRSVSFWISIEYGVNMSKKINDVMSGMETEE